MIVEGTTAGERDIEYWMLELMNSNMNSCASNKPDCRYYNDRDATAAFGSAVVVAGAAVVQPEDLLQCPPSHTG